MSVEGRDEPVGGRGGSPAVPPHEQVPGQGGRGGAGPGGDAAGGTAREAEPASSGAAAGDGAVTVPSQREAGGQGPTPPADPAAVDRAAQEPAKSSGSTNVPPSDADLIARMRSGDDSAYEDLYLRHAEAVRRYARTCCRDAHTADDLTAEVFARVLGAVRGGSGPEHAVRAYLLTTVRRVAAGWTKSARREHLVDDFAVFAAQSARSSEVSDDDTLDLGADVLAMHEAEQSLAMQAFRSLPERWQAVLWHTEVEDESPSQVATLFGLDANGTRVLASRAREGLKQAYLQAHVSATLASDEECARYADRLGAYARGGLRSRAERGLRKHLEECAKCRLAAGQIKEVASGIPGVVPIAVIGWFGAAGYAKVAALFAGGAATAGAGAAAGAASAAGGSSGGAGAGGAAASEGVGAPVKAGIAAGVVVAAGVAVALALAGSDTPPPHKAEAKPPVSQPVLPQDPPPAEHAEPGPPAPPPAAPARDVRPDSAHKPAAKPAAKKKPKPVPEPTPHTPKPKPPAPEPTTPPPAPPAVYQWSQLDYGVLGDGSKPEMRLGDSSWVWQRSGLSVDGQRYANGVTVHGRSSVTIDLNRSCSAYDAQVGVDDLTLGLGAVRFSVFADGARVWSSPLVRGGGSAVPVHVNLTGHKTIRLVVEPNGGLDNVALADWADSRFSCG